MSSDLLVDFRNVSFQYKPRDAVERGSSWSTDDYKGFQLNDVSFQVRPRERVIITGKNGSGKSTLLSCIAGKRKASSGTTTVLGRHAFDDTALMQDVALIGEPWPTEALFSCKVEAIVDKCREPQRRDALARELHLPMKASLNKMSSGQKRRVQILHGLMETKRVILMDECSTDIDVAERVTLMQFVAAECDRLDACAVYATHILDGVDSWATRVVLMEQGKILKDEPFSINNKTDGNNLSLELKVTRWLISLSPEAAVEYHHHGTTTNTNNTQGSAVVASGGFRIPQNKKKASKEEEEKDDEAVSTTPMIVANSFSFRDLYQDVTLNIPRGKRYLFCSCNGAGKTTLLELLAGHVFFPNKNNELCVDSRPCFQDTKAQNILSFGGHWWDRVPDGEMHVREVVALPLDERAESLRRLLCVDLDWDIRHTSTGELKRIQLLMKLKDFKPLVLLDEATADLDIHMRANLLRFLYDESEERGVTIVYSTHIFEGLGEWPTDVIFADRSQRKLVHTPTVGGVVVVGKSAADSDEKQGGEEEQLRSFLVRTLCELKKKEKWEEWYV